MGGLDGIFKDCPDPTNGFVGNAAPGSRRGQGTKKGTINATGPIFGGTTVFRPFPVTTLRILRHRIGLMREG